MVLAEFARESGNNVSVTSWAESNAGKLMEVADSAFAAEFRAATEGDSDRAFVLAYHLAMDLDDLGQNARSTVIDALSSKASSASGRELGLVFFFLSHLSGRLADDRYSASRNDVAELLSNAVSRNAKSLQDGDLHHLSKIENDLLTAGFKS